MPKPGVNNQYKYSAVGIDPGLAETGYAVIGTFARGGELCSWGCIKTSSRMTVPQRLQVIYQKTLDLISDWMPDIIVIEDVYVLKAFPKAAISLGEVRGVICLAAQNSSVDTVLIRPTEVKSGLTGNGRAGKVQVSRAVKRMLGIQKDIKPDHASDATALALIGLSRSGYYVL